MVNNVYYYYFIFTLNHTTIFTTTRTTAPPLVDCFRILILQSSVGIDDRRKDKQPITLPLSNMQSLLASRAHLKTLLGVCVYVSRLGVGQVQFHSVHIKSSIVRSTEGGVDIVKIITS